MSSYSQEDSMPLLGLYYTEDVRTLKQFNSNVIAIEKLQFSDGKNTKIEHLQRISTTWVDVVCTQIVATDPFDKNHILMGCTDISLLQSYDNVASWYRGLNEW